MRTAPTILLAAIAASATTALTLPLVMGTPANARTAVMADAPIAICDIATLSEELMDSDRFLPAREEKRLALQAALLDPLQARAKQLEEEFTAAQQSGDQQKMQGLMQQFQALQQEGQDAQAQFQQQLQMFISEQFKEAYGTIAEAAKAIGEDLGYDYVAASTPPDAEFEDETFADLLTEVLTRTYVAYPEGTDITADVRDDLNL